MTDQGLSIFDDEPDDVDAPETDPSAKDTADGGTDGEKTQVIPVVEKAARAQARPGAAREAAGDPAVARSRGLGALPVAVSRAALQLNQRWYPHVPGGPAQRLRPQPPSTPRSASSAARRPG